jgi:hypothetical protein
MWPAGILLWGAGTDTPSSIDSPRASIRDLNSTMLWKKPNLFKENDLIIFA